MAEREDGRPGLRELGDALVELVRTLPVGVHRASLRSGECTVEVEWTEPRATGAAGVPAALGELPATVDASDATLSVPAPMVGAYYGRPSPDQPPFVQVGDVVEQGQQVALIEAMKLFTPVLSDADGEVRAIRVEDGQMVEFGQPILDLVPAQG